MRSIKSGSSVRSWIARAGLLVPAALVNCSPAMAQEVRSYVCTANNSDDSFEVMIGPNEYQVRSKGNDWGMNFCQKVHNDPSFSCTFNGSQFVASLEGKVQFTLDTSTGEYFSAGDGMFQPDDERGTCRAE